MGKEETKSPFLSRTPLSFFFTRSFSLFARLASPRLASHALVLGADELGSKLEDLNGGGGSKGGMGLSEYYAFTHPQCLIRTCRGMTSSFFIRAPRKFRKLCFFFLIDTP